MPYKRLMIIIGIVLMLLLMIFANSTESYSEGISGLTSTGIHEATWTGNIEVVKQLIASDIDINVKRNRGETPLHIAAIFSRYEIAKLLISKGADVNARNDDGFTPLHQAAYSFTEGPQKIRTIELLISKGANVNSKGESGGTPLDIANTWGREPAADLLRKHGAKTGEELKAEGK